jgi:hypothetical protein
MDELWRVSIDQIIPRENLKMREISWKKRQDEKGENMILERMQGVLRRKASYESGTRETGTWRPRSMIE